MQELHKDLSIIPKSIKSVKNVYVARMIKKNTFKKQKDGLVLQKVRKIIKSIQKTWLKSYIDMNSRLNK